MQEGTGAVPVAAKGPEVLRRNSRSSGTAAPVSPESRRLLRTQGFVRPGNLAEMEAEVRTFKCQVRQIHTCRPIVVASASCSLCDKALNLVLVIVPCQINYFAATSYHNVCCIFVPPLHTSPFL